MAEGGAMSPNRLATSPQGTGREESEMSDKPANTIFTEEAYKAAR
jgi:hypothetical protein